MWQYHKSTFLCTHQRLKIRMWKIKMSSVLSLVVNGEIHKDPNNMNKARRDFFFQMLSQETAATWLSLGFISSAQCKSVVSAFWSFCRRSHFMLKIPLFFLVFWHLIFALKLSLVWVGTWCKAWIVCFCMYFQYLYKTQFHPKCHLRHSCIEPTIWYPPLTNEVLSQIQLALIS